MKPPATKRRADVQKAHYWLTIDFEIRAETLESAIKRCAGLFRKAYRSKLTEGLVYMGAHSARVRGSLHAKRTMHPTVKVAKDLPVVPGISLQELDAEEAARNVKRQAREAKRMQPVQSSDPGTSAPAVLETTPTPAAPVPAVSKRAPKKVPKGRATMKGMFG